MVYKNKEELKEMMSKQEEFAKQLTKTFPIFWRKGYRTGCWPGWNNLIWDCVQKIEKILESVRFVIPENVMPYMCQSKEKFGGLRLYYSWSGTVEIPEPSREEIKQIINAAEAASYTICEFCGSPGSLRNKKPNGSYMWNKTMCDTCWKKE